MIAAKCRWFILAALFAAVPGPRAQPFQPPTANRALLDPAGGDRAFVGTTGHPWLSGTFGCVRSGAGKFHEGIDIRCLQRDRRGEPIDPVLASAAGTVAYVSSRPSLSNYGNYVVLRHAIEGLEIYTLYAHLGSVRPGLQANDRVQAGERIGTMGRTANTREGISRERAHVHFEIDLVVNDRYAQWHAQNRSGIRNDHGNFNGQNLLGLDPTRLFLEQRRLGTNFNLVRFIQSQPEICRVAVRETNFPWLRRYRALLQRNPVAEREGIAGYELALTFNGLPCRVRPLAASELKSKNRYHVVSVNTAHRDTHPCGHLLIKRGQAWALLPNGERLLSLLMF